MAENVGKISYLVEIDTKNFSASLKEVDSAVKGASDSTGKSLDSLASKANIAVAATVAAFGAMAGAAVKSYANYEQLAGGVEKLFGKEQAQTIISNANNAFKTAGLSANDYMETATSFSASLIKGLGGDTARAAQLTDVAIRAMSDNVNTFGTDMSSVQYAFQGFAKQNYTMLDNLKLGYGGSAGEMAKLINDSGVLGDAMKVTAETVNNVSFDKIIEAIQIIQERQNIAGTTSKEAATTISGSWNSLTSAFQNVLTGVEGSGQQLSDSVLNMVSQLAQKVPPIVSNMVTGMGTAIKTSLDAQFGKGTFDIISTIVVIIGTLVGTFVLLYNTIKVATAIQAAFNVVLSANPIGLIAIAIAAVVAGLVFLQVKFGIFTQAWNAFTQAIQPVVQMFQTYVLPVLQQVGAFVAGVFMDAWRQLQNAWQQLMIALQPVMPVLQQLGQVLLPILGAALLIPLVPIALLVAAVIGIATAAAWVIARIAEFWAWIIGAWNSISGSVTGIVAGMINRVLGFFAGAVDFVKSVWGGIGNWFSGVVGGIGAAFSSIPGIISSVFSSAWGAATGLWSGAASWFGGIVSGIIGWFGRLPGQVGAFAQGAWNSLVGAFTGAASIGSNIISGIVSGLNPGPIIARMKEIASSALETVKSFLGIKSPSRVFRDQVGKQIGAGMALGISDSASLVSNSASKLSSGLVGTFDNITSPTIGLGGKSSSSVGGVSKSTTIGNIYLANDVDADRFLSRLDADQAIVSSGLAPNRSYA